MAVADPDISVRTPDNPAAGRVRMVFALRSQVYLSMLDSVVFRMQDGQDRFDGFFELTFPVHDDVIKFMDPFEFLAGCSDP
jgi:hypothetical protein